MIGNITKGTDFPGAVSYVLEKEGAVRLLSRCASDALPELKQEVASLRAMGSSQLSRECFHASLSLPPEDALTDDQWREVATRYMTKMGFEHSPWVAVRHTDTQSPHVHLVALRLDVRTGKTVSDWRDFERSATLLQGFEKDYGLTPGAKTPAEARQLEVRPTTGPERQLEARTGKACPRTQVEQTLVRALEKDGARTMGGLVVAMADRGVLVVPNVSATTGRVSGLRYELDEYSVKASQLGKAFGFAGLQEFVRYEPVRDLPTLFVAAGKAPSAELAEALGAERVTRGLPALDGYRAPAPAPAAEPVRDVLELLPLPGAVEPAVSVLAPSTDAPGRPARDDAPDVAPAPEPSGPSAAELAREREVERQRELARQERARQHEQARAERAREWEAHEARVREMVRTTRERRVQMREEARRALDRRVEERMASWRRPAEPEVKPEPSDPERGVRFTPENPPPDMPPAPNYPSGDPAYRLELMRERPDLPNPAAERFHEWRVENPDRDPYRPEEMPPDMPYPPPKAREKFKDPERALKSLEYQARWDKWRHDKVLPKTERAVAYHTWRKENPERDPYHPDRAPTPTPSRFIPDF